MVLAFLVFYVIIQSKMVEANKDTTDMQAKQIETIVVNELKVAESVTDGYYREFELPWRINGMDYTVQVMSGVNNTPEIVVKYNGRERVYFVNQGYISGNSTVDKGLNNITKINGIILVQHIGGVIPPMCVPDPINATCAAVSCGSVVLNNCNQSVTCDISTSCYTCTINAQCDDSDPLTTDTCGGSPLRCLYTPIVPIPPGPPPPP